jgi:hypothetical protein
MTELHDSEEVVGRIPVYDYRQEIPPAIVWPETHANRADVVGALAGFIVLGLLFVALFILWPVL